MSFFKILNELFGEEDNSKKVNSDISINDKLFEQEANILGLTKEQREDAKKGGLSPEEWLEANEPEYYRELDK